MLTKEDLTPELLSSYITTLNSIGKDETWGEVALNMKPLETWVKFKGFGLFRNSSFIAQVNTKIKGRDTLTPDMVLDLTDKDIAELQEELKQLKNNVANLMLEDHYRRSQGTPEERITNIANRTEKIAEYLNNTKPQFEKVFERLDTLEKRISSMEAKIDRLARSSSSNYDLQIAELNRRLYQLEGGKGTENGESD